MRVGFITPLIFFTSGPSLTPCPPTTPETRSTVSSPGGRAETEPTRMISHFGSGRPRLRGGTLYPPFSAPVFRTFSVGEGMSLRGGRVVWVGSKSHSNWDGSS